MAGYVARGREVKGVCRQRDCRRRCDIDVSQLVQRGLSAARIHDLKPLYRCQRLGACALDFREQHGVEITLSMLSGRDHVGVRIACGKYRKVTVAKAEAVVRRLEAEGTGGPDTKVDRLAELIRGACGRCGQRRWQVSVLWGAPDRPPSWARQAAKRPSG